MAVKLSGTISDITSRPLEDVSEVTVKSAYAQPSAAGITVTQPQRVDFDQSGSFTVTATEGVKGWLYVDGPGWSDSIPFIAAAGMSMIWEAIANALGFSSNMQDYLDVKGGMREILQEAADKIDSVIKWPKGGLEKDTDLNAIVEPGLYTIPSYTRAISLVNRPPNEAIQSATLTVTASGGGAIKQRWDRLGLSSDPLMAFERARDSTNTWSDWERVPDTSTVEDAAWFKGVIPSGANLDTYQTPGEFEIPSYGVARSLSGRPDSLQQRAMLKVRVAGGTAMHELTEWTSSGVRVWKRETAGGEWRAWREGEEPDSPNTPLQPVYMWGDSAVAGGDRNGSWATGENLPGRIGALLDTPVESRGVSGHTANTTLIRAGVLEIWATGTIPADTSEATINVAGLDIDLRVRRKFAASWDGIAGTLAIDGDKFTFKRSAAGSSQTISSPKRVILNTEVPLGEGAHIFLMGGNDWLSDAGTAPEANKEIHLVESYRRAVEAVPGNPLKKVLIGGLKSRRSTTAGDANDKLVRAVNQRLRTLYPGIFVDRQAWLASRGLAAAGISPTSADNAAMAAGLVPPSAFATGDDTHIRKEVVEAEAAELWANALVRKGWARLKSGTSLPAMVDTPVPDPYADLLETVNAKAAEVDNKLNEIRGIQSAVQDVLAEVRDAQLTAFESGQER